MSMLSCATIESRGTVGWSVNHCDPHSPFSSPVCDTKSSERARRAGAVANASAISSSATVPEPSSSAPLLTESGRAPPCARVETVAKRGDARRFGRRRAAHRVLRRPAGAATMIVRQHGVVIEHPGREADVIVVRADGDVLAAAATGSLPGRMPITLRDGIGRRRVDERDVARDDATFLADCEAVERRDAEQRAAPPPG